MKKIITLLFLLYSVNNFCQAQPVWTDTTAAWYDWDRIDGVATDHLGNVYTIGNYYLAFDADPGPGVNMLTPVGSYDIYLSKYDANGNFIWVKSFGGTGAEHAYTIEIDASDNIYIGGAFQQTVDFDPGLGITSVIADNNAPYSPISDGFISKFNASGDFIWVRTFGAVDNSNSSEETIRDLALDDLGNIYAIGKFNSYYATYSLDLDPGAGVFSIPRGNYLVNSFVVKLDANGNFINGSKIDIGATRTNPVAISVRNAAVYTAVNSDDDMDPTLSGLSGINKYDLNLGQLWNESWFSDVTIDALDFDSQGNLFFGGDFLDVTDFDPGPAVLNLDPAHSRQIFVCKLDGDGVFQWVKGFPQLQYSYPSIATLRINPQTGDCFIAGSFTYSGYFEIGNPYSYVTVTPGTHTGFVEQMDASGNFKAVYPFLALALSSGAEPFTLFFDQSSNLFVNGYVGGQVDLDPSAQGTYIFNSPGGNTFLSKWDVSEGTNYYNTKANLGLENLGTWSSTPDGTGPSPQNFSGRFNVINQTNAVLSGVLSLTGNNSKLIIGDGTNPVNLTVAVGSSYIEQTTSVDVLNNASLILQNDVVPALKTMADGSYVEFAQTGISVSDSIKIPVIRYYDLKLTGGLKNFGIGTTTVANDFVADGVASIGGTKPSNAYNYCYLECLGSVTFSNGTAFEPESVAASERRFGLIMNGAGPVQTITSNGTDIMLVGLFRTSDATCNVVLSPGTNIFLGAAYGGGLSFKSANAVLSCSGGSVVFRNHNAVSNFNDLGQINSNGTSFNVSGNSQLNYYFSVYTVNQGLKFIPGSTINDLNMSMAITGNYYYDQIHITGNVTVTGQLSLAAGFIDVPTGNTMAFANTATLNPAYNGNIFSFIQGTVNKTGASDFYFPVGQLVPGGFPDYPYAAKFAPVKLSNLPSSKTYTVFYKKQGYPVRTIDPTTLLTNPAYGISGFEYWQITPTIPGGSVDIRFYYTNVGSQILTPSAVSIAHFDGIDWNDIGGVPGVANNLNVGDVFVAGVSTFSPFTFGGTADVVVPVKLTSFTATKQDKVVKLNWITEQEINSKTFIVERSSDQRGWNEITRLNAAGYSNVRLNYTATDHNPAKGINYYRLKSLDVDEKFSYSAIRPVYFGNDITLLIAPNPASDKINIYLPGNTEMVSIQLFNVSGQLVKMVSTAEEFILIDISKLSKGMYTVKVNGKDINEVRTLIVE